MLTRSPLATRPTPSSRRPQSGRPRAWALAPLLALALAACSPDASPTASSTTSGSSGAAAGAGPSHDDSSAVRDAYDLRLAQCIRNRGVDVADPRPGEGITESGPAVRAAASACMQEIGPPPTRDFSKQEQQQIQDVQLTLAKCLRGLGYDVADPTLGSALAVEGVSDADFAACEPAPAS